MSWWREILQDLFRSELDMLEADYLLLCGYTYREYQFLKFTLCVQRKSLRYWIFVKNRMHNVMQYFSFVSLILTWEKFWLPPDAFKPINRLGGQLSLMNGLEKLCFVEIEKNVKARRLYTLAEAREYKIELQSGLELPWKFCALLFFPCLNETFQLEVKILKTCKNGHPTYKHEPFLKHCFCWKCGEETFKSTRVLSIM
ncbi:hypothetical protein [Spodoptera cosmioides nucleopolyhedrovirus]|uniref:Uncharacterized protein n=1 Tax=Spodoptera cosmioides nucleopolyhedrovirus TaxID=2605774 RepID=A0A6B7KKN8_9ABAC|nr:hypothetical protein [Spodoptera cosmioides nucleopolyhedrovirus]